MRRWSPVPLLAPIADMAWLQAQERVRRAAGLRQAIADLDASLANPAPESTAELRRVLVGQWRRRREGFAAELAALEVSA
jgi:hypothetical protein